MSPKTKLIYNIMNIALFLVLVFAVKAYSAPFIMVYPQTVLTDTSQPTGNHTLLFAYPFSLGQYRLFYNDSGNLYPLTQMVLDGAIVVRNYNPSWYANLVLLNASSYVPNATLAPAYSFVAGSQKLLNNGGALYSRNGYTCLSATSAVSYLYVPALTISSPYAYFYAYVYNSTLDSSSRIGFTTVFGDVNPNYVYGAQAVFTTYNVYAVYSSSTYISTSTVIPQNKLMLSLAWTYKTLTVRNYTSTWASGSTSDAMPYPYTYYPNIKVNTGKAVCVGLIALSASPIPFFSASYISKTTIVPLFVYSSQPFNVTYPKMYSILNAFISKNIPVGSLKMTLVVPASTISLLDASINTLFTFSFKAQSSIMLDGANVTYLKVNGNVYYLYPSSGQISISPPSNPSTITFTVQDYGAGYQVLQAYDLQGKLVGSGLIGSTGQVAMNLTPYASYMITICKPGLCKSVGLVSISSSNIQLSVMPTLPSVKPASWLSASYDYADKMLIVNVSCQYPPCTVTVKKIYANGTQAQYTLPACQQPLCSYAVVSPDPYFQVTANDSSGRQAQTNTGLSVPLWNSPLGNVTSMLGKTMNLDAWGVNINDFVVFLIGLAIIYAAFTYRNWELSIIVFGVWLTVGTLLLGGSGRLMVPGISLAFVGAALSYMLKREQQP